MHLEAMRSQLDISVRNPVTEKFTSYEIAIQTSNAAFSLQCSRTRRRYKEFVWLWKILKNHHPLCKPPELPPTRVFSDRFDVQFMVQRMKQLEDWLYQVVDVSLYLSDTTLHMFLQSRLSCKQMDDYLAGKLPEAVVEAAQRQSAVAPDDSLFGDLGFPSMASLEEAEQIACQSSSVEIQATRASPSEEQNYSGLSASLSESESDVDSSYDSSGSPLTVLPERTKRSCRVQIPEDPVQTSVIPKVSRGTSLVEIDMEQETRPGHVTGRSHGDSSSSASMASDLVVGKDGFVSQTAIQSALGKPNTLFNRQKANTISTHTKREKTHTVKSQNAGTSDETSPVEVLFSINTI